jgi:hypothetical protein
MSIDLRTLRKHARRRLAFLNGLAAVITIGCALAVFFAEKKILVQGDDAKVLLAGLLVVITFQVSQVLQTLALDVKLGAVAETASALHDLGEERKFLDDLVQKVALVLHAHDERCKRAKNVSQASKTRQHEILSRQLERILNQAAAYINDLKDGEFHTYFWSCRILIEQVRTMRTRLIGLSPLVTTDREWWTCPDAKEFLKANAEAIKKKKQIIRIFVYNDSTEEKLREFLPLHAPATTELYFIHERKLAEAGFPSRPEAVAVVDDVLLFTADTGKPALKYDQNVFSVNPEQIRERLAELEKIKRAATRYSPETAQGQDSVAAAAPAPTAPAES